jgi:hypothetical protein
MLNNPTSNSDLKISFIAVGPQKTATTWLYSILKQDKRIGLPYKVKETYYWDENFYKGEKWYLSHYKNSNLYAEIAPTYFHSLDSLKRLKKHDTDIKIIVTLRSPFDRTMSLYYHQYMRGRVGTDFHKAIEKYPEILNASKYSSYLPQWIKAFGRENILIILQDDILENPNLVLTQLYDFINLSCTCNFKKLEKKVNKVSFPKNYFLAGMATFVTEFLRKKQLYWVVNLAKKMGLKKVVYSGGKKNKDLNLGSGDIFRLKNEFDKEVLYVENLLNRKLPKWRCNSPKN